VCVLKPMVPSGHLSDILTHHLITINLVVIMTVTQHQLKKQTSQTRGKVHDA